LGARFRTGSGEKGWEMGIPGACSSPAEGSTTNSTPGVGRRRRRESARARERERGERVHHPANPGDWRRWARLASGGSPLQSGVVRSGLGPGGAQPHRATPGPFVFFLSLWILGRSFFAKYFFYRFFFFKTIYFLFIFLKKNSFLKFPYYVISWYTWSCSFGLLFFKNFLIMLFSF